MRLEIGPARRALWLRGLYMLLFVFIFGLIEPVILAIALFQFVSMLATGRVNDRLLVLGQGLARFSQQVIQFLTFVTEERPYPFSPWPVQAEGRRPA